MTFTDDLVGTCFICKRRHDNISYGPPRAPLKPVCWECLDDTSNGIRSKLPKVYHMPKRQLDDFERRALEGAMTFAGDLLEKIGKTDLAEFDEAECLQFCEHILIGYADSMRELVRAEVPF